MRSAAVFLLFIPCVLSGGTPAETAWDILIRGLNEGNAEKRQQAVTAVGSIGTARATKMVEAALKDKDAIIRQTAATLLGDMKARGAIPALRRALEDDDPGVAFAAARSLWSIGDRSARALFEDVVRGEQKTAPGAVTQALRGAQRKIRNPAQLALLGVEEASGALLGPASLGVVVAKDFLKDAGAGGRAVALARLGENPTAYDLKLIEWALNDGSWLVRVAAIQALGRKPRRGASARIQPLLNDSHNAVRYMAAAAVIRLGAG